MISVIESKTSEIHELCRTHGVKSFHLFGSAANEGMTEKSDFDFLVRFSNSVELLDYADNYFDLLEKLTSLFKRKIDLVSEKSLKNPILIKEINRTKVPIYES